jgi:hypothetical protein
LDVAQEIESLLEAIDEERAKHFNESKKLYHKTDADGWKHAYIESAKEDQFEDREKRLMPPIDNPHGIPRPVTYEEFTQAHANHQEQVNSRSRFPTRWYTSLTYRAWNPVKAYQALEAATKHDTLREKQKHQKLVPKAVTPGEKAIHMAKGHRS